MKLNEFLKSDKAAKLAIIIGLAVMALIFVTGLTGGSKAASEPAAQTTDNAGESEKLAEERLARILSEIEGAGEIHVMITLDRTGENVYNDRESSVLTTIAPTIRGVVVVCSGCRSATVREKVSEAVSKALGIGANRVCVTY